MSWESTVPYYRIINETVKAQLGGLHSAKLVLVGVDFHEIERLQHAGDWGAASAAMVDAARRLQAAGADFVVLCTNTMHKVADDIERAINLPLLHIADPTAASIKAAGHSTVGLLGTRFTMEQTFYRNRLTQRYGLDVIVPDDTDQAIVHRVIYDELCLGKVRDESCDQYRRIMTRLVESGAEAIILGCTEISLLVNIGDATVPLVDTTRLHAEGAARVCIGEAPLIAQADHPLCPTRH